MAEIAVTSTKERQILWTPEGYPSCDEKEVIVRDGQIMDELLISRCFINDDIDGVIEFLKAIKQAMIDTKED